MHTNTWDVVKRRMINIFIVICYTCVIVAHSITFGHVVLNTLGVKPRTSPHIMLLLYFCVGALAAICSILVSYLIITPFSLIACHFLYDSVPNNADMYIYNAMIMKNTRNASDGQISSDTTWSDFTVD